MGGVPVLADDDLHALDDGALLDRTAELIRERNRIDAELVRTVRVADARQGVRARRAEDDAVLAAEPRPALGRGGR